MAQRITVNIRLKNVSHGFLFQLERDEYELVIMPDMEKPDVQCLRCFSIVTWAFIPHGE